MCNYLKTKKKLSKYNNNNNNNNNNNKTDAAFLLRTGESLDFKIFF